MEKKHPLYHALIFKRRGWVGIFLLVPAVILFSLSSPAVKEGSAVDLAMDALGWLMFVFYVTFRLWATLYISGRKDKELQTQGPYSITRNPLYLGSFCLALSITLFFKSMSLFMATFLGWIIYSYGVVQKEETYLETQFGEDFRAYCRRTPRFFPRFSLHRSGEVIGVELKSLKFEVGRLWAAALIPPSVAILMHFRMASWWPHWFTLP